MSKKYIKVMTQEELDNMGELDDDFEILDEGEDEEKVGFFKKHKKGFIIGGCAALIAGLTGLITHAIDKKKYASDEDDYDDYEFDEIGVDEDQTTED